MPGLEIDLSLYPNEEALLAALRRGDADACTCLVKQFASRLYAAVLRILGDDDEADTVLQSAFIKACANMDSFEERSQLGTWLHRIAINEALMQRRKNRGDQVSLSEMPDLLSSDDAPGGMSTAPPDPSSAALRGELRAHLQQAIASLSTGHQQVFLLRDIWGLSVKETAEALSLSESAVKVRLHRARQQLREHLAGYLSAA